MHMSVSVSIYVCVCFSAHAQPFSFSSKYFLHKRQCILHLDKHWIFKVSSMIDNRLLDNMTNIWTQNHYITMDRINLLGWQQTPFESCSQPCPNTRGHSTCSDVLYNGHKHEVWLTTFSAQTLHHHKHMTAPKNAILPGQNWGFCPSPVLKISPKSHLTSSIFGCFESLIFTNFWHHRTGSFFRIFCPPPFQWRCFFPFFHHLPVPKTCPTSARRSVPDVCPTSPDVPDVCPTSARRLPVSPKNPRGWHSHFFAKFGNLQENGGVFFEKKTDLPKRREN